MPCKIKNPSNINLDSLEPHVQGMYDYFDQKLGFKKPPTMFFDSDPSNQSNVLGKTAYYDPSALEVHVFVDGRHPKDMLRSIAHELIHHQQNLEGRLDVGGYMGEGYYLKNEEMKKLEQEAMLEGNALMREYEDNLKLEEKNKMSLKEWKNNELNQLLLKKFGILKEEKNIKMVKKDEVPEDAEVVVPDGPGDLVGIKKEELTEEKDCPKCEEKPCKCEDKEEMEEGRLSPRTTNADKFVGHEDRYQPDRIHEEDELEEGSCGDKKYMKEEEDLEEGGAAARTGNENHDVGKGRMTPDRKHESKARKLKEALEIIAKTNKTILNSIKTKK
jgi:hypothetical protein